MTKEHQLLCLKIFAVAAICLLPSIGYCDVEGSLGQIQQKFTGVFLPALSIIGLVWAGLSMVSGNPNARSHLFWAVMGAAVGFGATSIVNYVKSIAQ